MLVNHNQQPLHYRRERWIFPLLVTAFGSVLFTHVLSVSGAGSCLTMAGTGLLILRMTYPDSTTGAIAMLLWLNTHLAVVWSPVSIGESAYLLSVVGSLVGFYTGVKRESRVWLLFGVLALGCTILIDSVAAVGLVVVPAIGWLLGERWLTNQLREPVVWACISVGIILLLVTSSSETFEQSEIVSLNGGSLLIPLVLGLLPWSAWVPLIVIKHHRRLHRPSMRSNCLPTLLLLLWTLVAIGYIVLSNAPLTAHLLIAAVPICIFLAAMLEDVSRLRVSVMMTLILISLGHAVLSGPLLSSQ